MFSGTFVWLCLSATILAHKDPSNGYPKALFGVHFAAEMRSRNIFAETHARDSSEPKAHVKRANCGPGVGSCATGLCCSSDGWVSMRYFKDVLLKMSESVVPAWISVLVLTVSSYMVLLAMPILSRMERQHQGLPEPSLAVFLTARESTVVRIQMSLLWRSMMVHSHILMLCWICLILIMRK